MEAAVTDEPPRDAKARVWRSIALAVPVGSTAIVTTTTANTAAASKLGPSASAGAGSAAIGGPAAGAGTAASATSAALLTKAIAIGVGLGVAVSLAVAVPYRSLQASKASAPVVRAGADLATPGARVASPAPDAPAAQATGPEQIGRAAAAKRVRVAGDLAQGEPRAIPRATSTPSPSDSPDLQTDADRLREESQLLMQARAAHNAGDGARALVLLGEHRRNFATGMLAQERDALEVQALVRVGQFGEARKRARAFLARFPGSPHSEKMRTMVGTQP